MAVVGVKVADKVPSVPAAVPPVKISNDPVPCTRKAPTPYVGPADVPRISTTPLPPRFLNREINPFPPVFIVEDSAPVTAKPEEENRPTSALLESMTSGWLKSFPMLVKADANLITNPLFDVLSA